MPRGMLCLTTPTRKKKLPSFGIMHGTTSFSPPSFLPLLHLSKETTSQVLFPGLMMWDITCGWPASSSPLAALKLLTGITPSVLYRSKASAEQKLQAHWTLVSSTTAGSCLTQYVPLERIKCNTHLPYQQDLRKAKTKSCPFILSYTRFFK